MPITSVRNGRLFLFLAFGSLWGLAGTACAPAVVRGGGFINFVRPDQRPPLVGETMLADSLWGLRADSRSGDGIADSRRADLQALVERFAPSLVLPGNDNAKIGNRRYWMVPTNVWLYADTLRSDLIRAAPWKFEDTTSIALRSLTPDSLAGLVSAALLYQGDPVFVANSYFDFPGTSARQWWEAYGRFRTGPDSARWAKPTVYAHPFIVDHRLAIQYWFFYPVNDFVGNHEGDWEHIIVLVSPDRQSISEVQYYFHQRSLILPAREFKPDIRDGTHPVVYVGGRMYNIADYPIRWLAGEHNEGSHGSYPFPGEWEAVAGLGGSETVRGSDKDSLRFISHQRFDVILTPEPSRIDYKREPTVLHEWAWLLLPVRWGFPVSTSFLSGLTKDVGNWAPWGPAFSTAWNRPAPGLLFPEYKLRRIPKLQAFAEDLLQPWYYLYAFRAPRYISDPRDTTGRKVLERLGQLPRSGWGERGFGTTALGLSYAYPSAEFDDRYEMAKGVMIRRSLWGKIRIGLIELSAGYQRFQRRPDQVGALYVYPATAALVIHTPTGRFRPYMGAGGGLYGWQSRQRLPNSDSYLATSGWSPGWNVQAGIEYYLRPRVALDVGLRWHHTYLDGAAAGMASDHLRFTTLWIGHYIRF